MMGLVSDTRYIKVQWLQKYYYFTWETCFHVTGQIVWCGYGYGSVFQKKITFFGILKINMNHDCFLVNKVCIYFHILQQHAFKQS